MLASGLPEQIADNEDLARFLTSSSQFSAQLVKPAAFMPSVKDGETSVFRHGSEPRAQLWAVGNQHIGRTRQVHGAAIMKAIAVRAAQLEVIASEPPPRHAAIVGWPQVDNDPELQKAQQKQRAALIASTAVLLRP
jgi:hypothetical protein